MFNIFLFFSIPGSEVDIFSNETNANQNICFALTRTRAKVNGRSCDLNFERRHTHGHAIKVEVGENGAEEWQ